MEPRMATTMCWPFLRRIWPMSSANLHDLPMFLIPNCGTSCSVAEISDQILPPS